MAGGRPTKLTQEVQDAIVVALKAGMYIEASCDYVGIAPRTYYKWMSDAEREDAAEEVLQFSQAVKKARAEAEYRNVQGIQVAGEEHWQARAWWLERSFPSRWGRQQRVQAEISGPGGGPIEVTDVKAEVLSLLASHAEDNDPTAN